MSIFHESALLHEVVEALDIKSGETYVDATLGGGGHTRGILGRGGKVIGVDLDEEALNFVRSTIKSEDLVLMQGNFVNLDQILEKQGIKEVSGIVFDLGVSSHQLDSSERGFSFRKNSPLDMRMSLDIKVTAGDLVNGLNEGELYELFTKYGEERNARRISRAVVRSRFEEEITTTKNLAGIIERVVGNKEKIHPATRVFLALRIAVNDELNNLEKVLPKAASLLKKNGRLVVISFHSLEDRLVKNFIRNESSLTGVNKKPIVPKEEEIKRNSRVRSAKLRIAEKIN